MEIENFKYFTVKESEQGELLAVGTTKDKYRHTMKLSELDDKELDELCQEIEVISKKYGLRLVIDRFDILSKEYHMPIAYLTKRIGFFTFHDVSPKFIDSVVKYNIDSNVRFLLDFKRLYDGLSAETKLFLEVKE